MTVDRRRFIEWAMFSGILPATSSIAASFGLRSTTNTPRFLVVMLRGACDTDSLLYQYNNSFYFDSRPNIAIGRDGLSDEALRVDNTWAMHPAFLPLAPLLPKRELVFIPFSGSDDRTRSHFQAQEVMEIGIDADQAIGSNSGWLNRVVSALKREYPKENMIGGTNFGRASSLICRGPEDMPDLQLVGKPGKADDLQRKTDVLMKMYEEAGYADRLMSVADRRIQLAQEQLMGKSHGARYESAGDVVGRFRQIGRLMRQGGGFSVGFLDLNGWDTHVSQGADAGPLSTKLRQLANGLAAFRQEMNDVWSVCQVLVISEFGRTYRENGNRGTDHGRGTTAMLLSGQPYTQSVLGEQLIHAQHSLNENRDWPVLNNYREVVSRVVLGRMGLDPKASREVMRLG